MENEPGTELVKYGTELVTDPGVQRLMGQVVGAPTAEAAARHADEIRYRRFFRQVKIYKRASEMLDQAGIPYQAIGPVDLTVLVPLLESGSLQDDDAMTDRWAALLVNAATEPDGVPPSYPEILRQLTPREAAILDHMYEDAGDLWQTSPYEPEVIAERAGFAVDRVILSADNLLRLRLVRHPGLRSTPSLQQETKLLLTHLGHDFVSCCRPPTKPG